MAVRKRLPHLLIAAGSPCLLLVNSGYIAALPRATVFYMGNVALHVVLGLGLMVVAAALCQALPARMRRVSGGGSAGAIPGGAGEHAGAPLGAVAAHPAGAAAVLLIGLRVFQTRAARVWKAGFAAAAACWCAAGRRVALPRGTHEPNDAIVNPRLAPLSMDQEGAGRGRRSRRLRPRPIPAKSSPPISSWIRRRAGMPQGYLRAVEKFGAPFRFVQQPVLPESHRVHAGHHRHASEQMVRRMSRPCGLL